MKKHIVLFFLAFTIQHKSFANPVSLSIPSGVNPLDELLRGTSQQSKVLSDNSITLPENLSNILSYNALTEYSYKEHYTVIAVKSVSANLELVIPRCKYLVTQEYCNPWGFELKAASNGINVYENPFYSPFFDHDLKTDAEQALRRKPYAFISLAIKTLETRGAKNVLEIGSARSDLGHPLNQIHECCNDGHSTFHWVHAGFHVTTIDINPACKSILEKHNFPNLNVLTGDALKLLKQLDKSFDLVFFDAWDLAQGNYAKTHLEAYDLIKDNLNKKCLILIDDTDIANCGKGELLIPQLLKDGFHLKILGRQALFARE